jgi:hypothetical protein
MPQGKRLLHDPGPAALAGIPTKIDNHTFRATGITAYLGNGGSLEYARSPWPRTTKLYDRTKERLAQDEVVAARKKPGTFLIHESYLPCGRLAVAATMVPGGTERSKVLGG